MSKKRKKTTKTKTIVRIVTLVMGLGFAGSTLAIALSSVFSQNNYQSQPNAEGSSIEEQIQMQVEGYQKVLAREPKNITALEGLAQIYFYTGNTAKAIPILEKIVEYYPERQEYAGILQSLQQQQAIQESQPEETTEKSE